MGATHTGDRFPWQPGSAAPGRTAREHAFLRTFRQLAFVAAMLCAIGAPLNAAEPQADAVDFSRDIRPILAEHCLQCHGPDKAEGGLRLHERNTALARLDSGSTALVPGQPDASELLRRVTTNDAAERMPPEKPPLKPAQIELLRRWIAAGGEFTEHWAFRPLARLAPPHVRNAEWPTSPLDHFVLSRLETEQLEPSPPADRRTLIKRLTYDLHGLLPSTAEVDAFLQDDSPQAYENLVDRLLRSPRFGERWGRHWLDMARYADSDGYEKDRARPDAYLYRDWVIAAYNDDLPFDQFTLEQLAGDLVPQPRPSQLIATAFQRQTLTNEEGGVDQEEYRVAAVFDRTETVGSVWLGLTVGCARCHNHKYDPISQQDYYRLFAFFNNADEVDSSLPTQATDLNAYQARVAPLRDALERRRAELATLEQQWETEQRDKLLLLPNEPLKPTPLAIDQVTAASEAKFTVQTDGSYLVTNEAKDETGDTYSVIARLPEASRAGAKLTGLRLDALPDDRLPNKGPGLSEGGNFVVTGLRAEIVNAEGQVLRPLELQRVNADHQQQGFKATDVLIGKSAPRQGWAIGGKIGAAHHLQVRFVEPLQLANDERLRVVFEQNYGKRHALGRWKLAGLIGDERSLYWPENIVTALEMYPEKRVAATRQTLFDYFARRDPQVQQLERQINDLNKEFKVQFRSVRTLSNALKPRTTHVLHRGEFLQPTTEVHAAVLDAPFAGIATPTRRESAPTVNRLELARWLVGPTNPLTPRVAVNHVWSHLFGAGLVRTPNDFGLRGERPTHPELLDWLANTYRDELGWSTKRLIKQIVMSSTYRQASVVRPKLAEHDPSNMLWARQNRWRVEGEVVRDLALDAAGLLSAKVGGPSVFPPMPGDLAKLSYANNFSWKDSEGVDRYRRGMYTFFKRTIPHPLLMTFDCPDANVACVQRSISNTPLQALTLLNNESFVEAALALARRLLMDEPAASGAATSSPDGTQGGADRGRLERAFQICLVRPPRDTEVARFAELLHVARTYYAAHADEAQQLVRSYAPASPAAKESAASTNTAELAAWTATLRVLLNLDEFVTRG